MNYFSDYGFFVHNVLNLSAKEAYKLCEGDACIIDVRETYISNFRMFGVRNLVYLPYSTLKDTYMRLPDDSPLIFADAVGLHSREAVLFMLEKGYQNVANLAGGIVDWERDGLPVTTDKEYRLTGSCICQLKTRKPRS